MSLFLSPKDKSLAMPAKMFFERKFNPGDLQARLFTPNLGNEEVQLNFPNRPQCYWQASWVRKPKGLVRFQLDVRCFQFFKDGDSYKSGTRGSEPFRGGAIPSSLTKFQCSHSSTRIEHLATNQKIGGSNPSGNAISSIALHEDVLRHCNSRFFILVDDAMNF